MIFLMFFQISKTCWSFKNTVFLQEFNDFHIIYFGLNRCIHHPKNLIFISCVMSFVAYNLLFFWASITATKFYRFLPRFWVQNGSKKKPESFRKSLIPMFVAKLSFWHPLADFGLHFCSPGHPFWLHYGRWGCCFRFTLLDRVYFWTSVLIITAIYAPF